MRTLLTICLLLFALIAQGASVSPNSIAESIAEERALAKHGATKEAHKVLDGLIAELRREGRSTNLSKALNDLSGLLASDGDYTGAAKAAAEAQAVSHVIADRDGEARALDNLGVAQLFLGDYVQAQAHFAAELDLVRILRDRQAEVQTANNLGSAYFYQGNYSQAFAQYQVASQVLDEHSQEPWFDAWRQITDLNTATLYQRLSRYQKALQIYRRVQASSQKTRMSAADQAQLLSNLGALYRHLGDPYKAIASYKAALPLLRHQHNADAELGILTNLGTVYALDRGDLPRAAALFQRVLALAEKSRNRTAVLRAHLYLGEAALRAHRLDPAQTQFDAAAGSAKEIGSVEDLWQAQYGLGRVALGLADPARAEERFRQAVSTIESVRGQMQIAALKAEFLAEKRDVYDALIGLLLNRKDVSGVFEFMERSRARSFQDHLQSTASGDASAAISLSQVRGHLDGATLLLEFWQAEGRIAMLWATRDASGVEARSLSPAEWTQLQQFVRGLPGNLNESWRAGVALLNTAIPQSAAPFRRAELEHVLIVPDGLLNAVPFEIAPLNDHEIMIERYDVTYLPTAALLLRQPVVRGFWQFPWQQQLVAFGSPVLEPSQGTPAWLGDTKDALPLPGAEAEIRALARMVPGRATLFLGNDDHRANFLGGAAASAPLLHVSTHGFADDNQPERTRLLFSPAAGSAEPEYVFLRELAALDLSGVDLATISSCDSERGQMIRGEGIQAFSSVLLSAGARSTATTLWKIADHPTAEFIQQFYFFAVVRGQTKAEAMRSAKLKLLRSGSSLASPRHWAGFVLSGEGMRPVPGFLSWREIFAGLAFLLGVVYALVWGLLRFRVLAADPLA